jgi:hypothetical protein
VAINKHATLEVLTEVEMKNIIFWDSTPHGQVEVYRDFGEMCCSLLVPAGCSNTAHSVINTGLHTPEKSQLCLVERLLTNSAAGQEIPNPVIKHSSQHIFITVILFLIFQVAVF